MVVTGGVQKMLSKHPHSRVPSLPPSRPSPSPFTSLLYMSPPSTVMQCLLPNRICPSSLVGVAAWMGAAGKAGLAIVGLRSICGWVCAVVVVGKVVRVVKVTVINSLGYSNSQDSLGCLVPPSHRYLVWGQD